MIRKARPEDAAALAEIGRSQPSAAGWNAGQFEEETRRGDAVFLAAEESGVLVGYGLFREAAGEAQILDVAVRPGLTRRGIGRRLVGALAEEARRRRLARMTLEVAEDNEAARRLYQSLEFKDVGRRPNFYGPGRAALLMDRELPGGPA